MKRYYFTIASILFLAIGITSCSNEETKTQTQVAARPTVPLQNGEVQIGTQIWMTKNLNVSRYRNGDPIPQVTNMQNWDYPTGAWCYLGFNASNGVRYGKLYNGYAVNDPRGLAPVGYHIPSKAEWEVLVNFLGGASVAGGKMKATGQWHFDVATNSSGFTALPANVVGYYGFYDGWQFSYSFQTQFWGSLLDGGLDNSSCYLNGGNTSAQVLTDSWWLRGCSVRCIKD